MLGAETDLEAHRPVLTPLLILSEVLPVRRMHGFDGGWTTHWTSKGSRTENRKHTDEGPVCLTEVRKPSCDLGRVRCQGRTEQENRGLKIQSLAPSPGCTQSPRNFSGLNFAINKIGIMALGEQEKTKPDNYNNGYHCLNTDYKPLWKSFCMRCFLWIYLT